MASAPQPGEAAPPLDLPTLQDGRVALADLRGRVVLVSFLRHAG